MAPSLPEKKSIWTSVGYQEALKLFQTFFQLDDILHKGPCQKHDSVPINANSNVSHSSNPPQF